MEKEEEEPNKFVEEFEKLVEKHNIEKYILISNVDNRDLILYRPGDIMEITRTLLFTHRKFHNEVMTRIGESAS